MSPRGTMRPYLLSLVLLLAATATVPLVSAICISRFEKSSESKSEAHGAAATNGGSVKTLSLEEYGLPKKAVEKPKEVNPYEAATSAKASTAFEKPDKLEEPSAPKKVKKEKSDDSDVSAAYVKKEKKEKSDDSDKKEKKKKFVGFDVSSASPKKEKKEKSDDSDKSSSSKKKKKDKSDDVVSPKKEKKEKKSDDDSDEDASAKKAKKAEEKKKKALKADASAYFKKEKKTEKAKHKKGKSNNDSSDEEDEDAAPVDVSATGEYVSPDVAKSEEDTTPAGISSVPTELAPAAKGYADDYASQKTQAVQQQPMGGAPDELPPSAKSSAAASTSQQPMGGAPDELPPSLTKSSGDPYAGVPNDPKQKPKLSMESFEAMKMKLPFPRPHVPVSPETKRVCGDTQYPEDCEESIAEIPGVESQPAATDPVAVLRLAMEAVREKTVVALNAATDRMNAAGLEKVVKEALNDCAKSYMDIKAALGEVDAALKRGDLATARTNLDSVETDLTSCDDGFNERGTPSVMTDHDQELQKLASDLIAIGANSIH
ncbi:unnamed protein product [Urochloa decumbens]|uniref:Pectinesterase inhibitor domain-containing protein n=1 Tax=Urochloa decumbens TaxID=240449 RepID=A0ABC9HGI5_9POAL